MKGALSLILISLATTLTLEARLLQAPSSAEPPKKTETEIALSDLEQGQTYLARSNFGEAERLFKQALGVFEKSLGPDDPHVAIALNSLATLHRVRENYEAAAAVSRRSLEILEKNYGPEHPNVAIGLNNLVLIHRLQKKHAEAELMARRSAAILQKTPGSDASHLAQSLENLAEICLELGKSEESEQLYRRVLSVRWGSGANVAPILEGFAGILNLAYFDKPLQSAVKVFWNTSGWDAINLDSYVLMAQALQVRGLSDYAENILTRAIRVFPHSRALRYALGDIYAKSSRWRPALDMFQEAARLDEPMDPALDRRQRSRIHSGIARMDARLAEFDAARTNFRTALDLDPGNVDARVALGDLYLQLDRTDDAAAEYAQAILLSGGDAGAYYGIAELNRRVGRFPQSVVAAEKALALNSHDAKSSYVRAIALLRTGRQEDGEAALEQFRKLQAEERDRDHTMRSIRVVIQTAVDRFERGQAEDALDGLREGIRVYPDSGLIRLNLGILQSRLGRHHDAVKTFESMIALGFGDYFLVHLNLSQEYEILGEKATSQRYRLNYLQRYNTALRNGLP